jgi:hypothetical protein
LIFSARKPLVSSVVNRLTAIIAYRSFISRIPLDWLSSTTHG